MPTINGYKRLIGGEAFWAPNAVTYGYDSRAASIRIISPPSCPPAGTRLEIRIPGADMNPYFALSAILLLGMRGINKKIPLPGPPIGHFTPEDRSNGKVRPFMLFFLSGSILFKERVYRSRCCLPRWKLRQRG